MLSKDDYMKEIAERAKKNRVYRKYQSTGLALAEILEDAEHKALYIRLAKQHDEEKLLTMAKNVAEGKDIKNRGAYFMKLLKEARKEKKI